MSKVAAARDDFKVVILDGGPAGCASALSLIAAGVEPESLLVVKASRFERDRIGKSIPPDTRSLFEALGVLPSFLAEAHEPCYGSASSWGSDELGSNDFLYNPYGNGWHLDRRRFDAWLADEVESRRAAVHKGYVSSMSSPGAPPTRCSRSASPAASASG